MFHRVGLHVRQQLVGYLALFVAIGGVSYAAVSLPKNSVGTKQLKKNAVSRTKIRNNAVNGAKIADNSVQGADILESSLGQVPSAAAADNAAHATAADNAAHATAADSAQNAANAANAANADKLDGTDSTGFYRSATKVADSDKLDGLDSTAFARGNAAVNALIATDVNLGLHDVISLPGVGVVRASCGFTSIAFDYKNTSGGSQYVVQERAGAYTEFENVANNADTTDTAATEPNGVTFHVAGSGFANTTTFIVHADIANGTAGPCVYQGTIISSAGTGAGAAAVSRSAEPTAGQRTVTRGSTTRVIG